MIFAFLPSPRAFFARGEGRKKNAKSNFGGRFYHGNEHQNQNYLCYGKNVLAVANGKVIATKDGLPENIPHSGKLAVPISLDTLGGNYIVLDIGKGKYAFYAHMIPGSLRVKVGEKVTRGQFIGQVGNTGNSTEPHLHFHIVDGPSFVGANGVPYGFDHFDVRKSKLINPEKMEVQILNNDLTPYSNQLVLENTVMKFTD